MLTMSKESSWECSMCTFKVIGPWSADPVCPMCTTHHLCSWPCKHCPFINWKTDEKYICKSCKKSSLCVKCEQCDNLRFSDKECAGCKVLTKESSVEVKSTSVPIGDSMIRLRSDSMDNEDRWKCPRCRSNNFYTMKCKCGFNASHKFLSKKCA